MIHKLNKRGTLCPLTACKVASNPVGKFPVIAGLLKPQAGYHTDCGPHPGGSDSEGLGCGPRITISDKVLEKFWTKYKRKPLSLGQDSQCPETTGQFQWTSGWLETVLEKDITKISTHHRLSRDLLFQVWCTSQPSASPKTWLEIQNLRPYSKLSGSETVLVGSLGDSNGHYIGSPIPSVR